MVWISLNELGLVTIEIYLQITNNFIFFNTLWLYIITAVHLHYHCIINPIYLYYYCTITAIYLHFVFNWYLSTWQWNWYFDFVFRNIHLDNNEISNCGKELDKKNVGVILKRTDMNYYLWAIAPTFMHRNQNGLSTYYIILGPVSNIWTSVSQ